jgi:polyhydroxybutyrate depolymerase
MTRSNLRGATTIAVGLLLAAAAGCGSSNGSGGTGTAGSSGGSSGSSGDGGASAGSSGSAGRGGTTGAAGNGGNSAGAAGTAVGGGGRGGGSGATGASGRGGGAGGRGGGNAAGRGGSSAAGNGGTTGAAGSGSGGSGAGGAAMPSAGCGTTPTTTAETTYMIDVAGTSRSYIVTLPASYNASQPHQLVFAWHGRTGTAAQIARGNYYGLKSRMTNAIFIAGQGLGTTADPADTGWPNTNGQDIAFVRAALAWMNANYCVDQARVFSVGFSYGGIMSHTIACQMSDTFRAVAPIAGAIFGRPTCLTHPIAAWMTHGSMDTSASGGVDFTAGESARDRIVALNHCTTTTVAADPSPCVAYQGCDAGYPVQWCAHDGAHIVPTFAAAAIATFFLQF